MPRNQNVLTVIFWVLVLSCSSMSAVFTYHGLQRSMGGFAILAALVITLMLIASDMLIRSHRLSGRSLAWPLVIFSFALTASFVSNFNHLYTNAMQRDVAADTVTRAYEVFRGDLSKARSALEDSDDWKELVGRQTQLDRELAQLKAQIYDPANPGVGALARAQIDRVYAVLGSALTDLRAPGATASRGTLDAWFSVFSSNAQEDLSRQIAPVKDRYEPIFSSIDAALSKYTKPSGTINPSDLPILTDLKALAIDVVQRANAILPPNAQIEASKIDIFDGRLGEIEFSLYNGFVERPNFGTTVLQSLIALSVDLIPLIFALAAFRQSESYAEPGVRGPRSSVRPL